MLPPHSGFSLITRTGKIIGQLLQKEGTDFDRSIKQSTARHQCAMEQPHKVYVDSHPSQNLSESEEYL